MKTTRRHFLCSVTSLLACAALSPASALAAEGDAKKLVYKLNVLMTDTATAATIGEAYLKQAPEEADAEKLANLICGTPERRAELEEATPGARRKILEELTRGDFERNDTVSIAGWVLARTDARRCALASITRPATP